MSCSRSMSVRPALNPNPRHLLEVLQLYGQTAPQLSSTSSTSNSIANRKSPWPGSGSGSGSSAHNGEHVRFSTSLLRWPGRFGTTDFATNETNGGFHPGPGVDPASLVMGSSVYFFLIQKILDYLPFADMKRSRLVSPLWRDCSEKRFLDLGTTRLISHDWLKVFHWHFPTIDQPFHNFFFEYGFMKSMISGSRFVLPLCKTLHTISCPVDWVELRQFLQFASAMPQLVELELLLDINLWGSETENPPLSDPRELDRDGDGDQDNNMLIVSTCGAKVLKLTITSKRMSVGTLNLADGRVIQAQDLCSENPNQNQISILNEEEIRLLRQHVRLTDEVREKRNYREMAMIFMRFFTRLEYFELRDHPRFLYECRPYLERIPDLTINFCGCLYVDSVEADAWYMLRNYRGLRFSGLNLRGRYGEFDLRVLLAHYMDILTKLSLSIVLKNEDNDIQIGEPTRQPLFILPATMPALRNFRLFVETENPKKGEVPRLPEIPDMNYSARLPKLETFDFVALTGSNEQLCRRVFRQPTPCYTLKSLTFEMDFDFNFDVEQELDERDRFVLTAAIERVAEIFPNLVWVGNQMEECRFADVCEMWDINSEDELNR